jgi:MFS family permease
MMARGIFGRFWLGQTASVLGDTLCLAALPLIAGLTVQANPAEMATLGLAISLPSFLLALPAGALVDRCSRRRTLIAADIVRAGAMAGLALAAWGGGLGIAALCLAALVVSSATLFFEVAAQSILPDLVAGDGVVGANAKLEMSRSAGNAGGPALAASLLQALGPLVPLVAALTFYLGAAGFYARLADPPRPVASARNGMAREIAAGIGFLLRHPVLRALALCALLWNVAWFTANTVLVLYSVEYLRLGAAEIGLAFSLQGVGMFLGALAARALVARIGLGRSLLIGPVTSALALPLLLIAGPVAGGLALGAALFLLGVGPSVWVVTQTSLRQVITPAPLLGRVNATIRFATAGMRPLGALLGGFLGSIVGLEATITVAALLFALCILPVALSRAARLRTIPV